MQGSKSKVFARVRAAITALVVAFCCAFAMVCAPAGATTAEAAGSFTVYVGYAGGPFYAKQVYSEADLWALSDGVVHEYSTIDASKNLRKGFGEGVQLSTLFANAGITTSVTRFVFDTSDGYAGNTDGGTISGDPWGYSELINSVRYYYPDYPTHWSYNLHGVFDKEGLEATRVSVPSILALRSSFLRITSQEEADLLWNDSTRMSQNSGYRLMFGAVDSVTGDARSFASMVNGIYCIMEGAAEINFSNNVIQGEVGDVIDISPTIIGTNGEVDSTIAAEFYKDIQYQISDPEKAELIQKADGSYAIKILAEGDFSIGYSYSTSEYDAYTQYSTGSLVGVGTGKGSGDDGDGGGDGDDGSGTGGGEKGDGGGKNDTGGTGGGTGAGIGEGDGQNVDVNTGDPAESTPNESQMQTAGGDMEGAEGTEGEAGGEAAPTTGEVANEVVYADIPVTANFAAFELDLLDDPTGDPNKQIDTAPLIVAGIVLFAAGFIFGIGRTIAARDRKVKVSKKDVGGAPNLRDALT